jgi:hypothetical protein
MAAGFLGSSVVPTRRMAAPLKVRPWLPWTTQVWVREKVVALMQWLVARSRACLCQLNISCLTPPKIGGRIGGFVRQAGREQDAGRHHPDPVEQRARVEPRERRPTGPEGVQRFR